MNKENFVIFIFGAIIIFGGWFITTNCHAKELHISNVERCYEVTPGVFKCVSPTGTTRTIVKV